MKNCEVCNKEFKPWKKKQRTCSYVCGRVIQLQTIGHGVNYKHGYAKRGAVEHLHGIWRGLIKRCTCVTNSRYADYGGRGITVCSEWLNDYTVFREWALTNGYTKELTIDRIDNDKGYSPDNCKFSTRSEQARNRRSTRYFTIGNITKSVCDWAEDKRIKYATAYAQLRQGRY